MNLEISGRARRGTVRILASGASSLRALTPHALSLLCVAGTSLSTAGTAAAVDRYVDAAIGANVPDCSVMASPCQTIQYALSHSLAGDTIHIAAGTYPENVVIGLDGITLQGAGAGIAPTDTILDGTAIGTDPGITILGNVTDVRIYDLRVQNYASDSGIYGVVGNDGLVIERVHTVANNTTQAVNGGGIYMNGPVSDVLINEVLSESNRARGIVIWNGFKQNITITNCIVRNNNCCGIELQDGTASGVTIQDNLVENQTDSGMSAVGLTSGAGANVISGNTVRDNGRFGIEVKMPNGTGLETGDGSIVYRDNLVERTNPAPADLRDHAGIAVHRRAYVAGQGYADIPTGVIVRDNTVRGYRQPSDSDGFGIVVEGTNMLVRNNTLTDNDVGIQIQQGHLPYTANAAGDGDQSNLADTFFGRGNSPVASGVIAYNSVAGNTVGIRNVGVAAADAAQACNWWDSASGPTAAANPGGTGQPKDGDGAFAPWLVYGTDADAGAEGFQLPASFPVTPAGAPSPADNDFTRLANAVQCVVEGQTIEVDGTFDWSEPNAAARWASGIDDLAATDDDYAIVMPPDVDGVTLTAATLGDAVINGPGDLPSVNLETFLLAFGGTHQDWTVSNLVINDFDLALGLFATASTQFAGFSITGNHIRVATDLNATVAPADVSQNIGIHLSFGQNQTVSNNTIDFAGDGASDSGNLAYASSVGLQSNTSGGSVYDGLLIHGNTLRVLGDPAADPEIVLGLWENAHGHTSNIVVSNNDFVNLGGANDPLLNLQRAFRVTSHSGVASTVTYSGNTVSGANLAFQWITGSNFSGQQPIEFTGNLVDDVDTGVLVQSNGRASMTLNRVTNATTAVSVADGSVVDLDCNAMTSAATGLASPSAGVTASRNNISGNAVGIDVVSDSGAGTSVFSADNRIAGNGSFGARNATPYAIDATGNWWGCATGADTGGCDATSGSFDTSGFLVASLDDSDADGFLDGLCDPDSDDDGVMNAFDNCPVDPNPLQEDADGDLAGDACDVCPNDPLDDADADGVCGDVDNCPDDANALQEDSDSDLVGDACDACPDDPLNDVDGDGVCGDVDNCPDDANPDQADQDNDDVGNVCDDDDAPGSLLLSRVRIRADGPALIVRGRVGLAAVIFDGPGGTLTDDLALGNVYLEVDAGGFATLLPLGNCVSGSARIRCRNAAERVTATFAPLKQGASVVPDTWKMRVLQRRVDDMTMPTAPAVVTLVQPTPAVSRTDDIANCVLKPRSLRCRED